MLQEFFMIGEILRPQGVRGQAKVRPYASEIEDFMRWDTLYLEENGSYIPKKAVCARVHDGFAYLTLEGCTGPEDVEKLRDRKLYIRRDQASPLEDGAVYIQDLIGCQAVDEKGNVIGELRDVLQYGSVDTYVFRTPKGQMMAPALLQVFPETRVEEKTILVNAERLSEVAVYED
ncbi:MAG: 16S rRNA processing protein RimM [Clostridia bacterium]|nr:16S rRNA processing protein RimM [Clostridia bacterium]